MPCIVAISDNDQVTEMEVRGILKRHGIRYGYAGHMFSRNGIAAFAPAKRVAKILAIEAPPDLFSAYIAGQRKFSEVALPWSTGKSIGQLNEKYPSLKIADRWVKIGLPDASKGGFEFRVRYYRGEAGRKPVVVFAPILVMAVAVGGLP